MDVEGAEQVNAAPVQIDQKMPWFWDTAAGRHIIGRQALSSEMKSCLRKSVSPVAFATGGGSQPGQESLGFEGSKILEGEEVYVLKECPPAQSIGKTVVDKGYLFVWDPSESVPYLVAPQDIKRCTLEVPRNARICASRVVEYVPQYDEEIKPVEFNQGSRMVPTATAIPAESEEVLKDLPPAVEEAKDHPAREFEVDEGAAPSIADAEGPNLEDVAEVGEVVEPGDPKAGGAASSAPKRGSHPLDAWTRLVPGRAQPKGQPLVSYPVALDRFDYGLDPYERDEEVWRDPNSRSQIYVRDRADVVALDDQDILTDTEADTADAHYVPGRRRARERTEVDPEHSDIEEQFLSRVRPPSNRPSSATTRTVHLAGEGAAPSAPAEEVASSSLAGAAAPSAPKRSSHSKIPKNYR